MSNEPIDDIDFGHGTVDHDFGVTFWHGRARPTSGPVVWTLDQGVALIRSIAQLCEDCHWIPSLFGSVLFHGQSANDLDILLSPKGMLDDPRLLLQALMLRGWKVLQLSPGLCGY